MEPQLKQNMERSDRFIVVKNWHVVISFLVLLVTVVTMWAQQRDDLAYVKEEVRELKARPAVSPEMYKTGQEYLDWRLKRIEGKIDAADVNALKGTKK